MFNLNNFFYHPSREIIYKFNNVHEQRLFYQIGNKRNKVNFEKKKWNRNATSTASLFLVKKITEQKLQEKL